ncbi:type II toxin-antitoxin system VapC family toxin [Arvimicrobium flavum]|uniref:type II toxin-antitoxin system VapC family toxin n=1 Tax=Arvimicrobium flavum TaxID=3393320 RepID=UPI00237A42B3|nr:type II toxin-antitoxin system VapC family toxin [Mesorhizobium shangrilense]
MSFVTDSSAIIAILKRETDAEVYASKLALDVPKFISAGSLLECGVVVGRGLGTGALANMNVLLRGANIEPVAFDPAQYEVGLNAYLLYGRGSGHRANLNFGDCFSYALAKTRGLPLLFKGDDFIHTDVEPALGSS